MSSSISADEVPMIGWIRGELLQLGAKNLFARDLLACIDRGGITLREVLAHEFFDAALQGMIGDDREAVSPASEEEEEEEFPADFPTVGSLIGATSTSRVYAVSAADGTPMVAKLVPKARLYHDRTGVPLEVKIMMDLSDMPGVSHIDRYCELESRGRPTVAIVMDRPAGEFSTYHGIRNARTDDEKRVILSKLVDVLRRLDQRRIAHNDLHENNILVSGTDVTLIDFGRAQYKDRPFHLVELYRSWDRSPPELRERGVFDYDRMTTWCIGLIVKRSFGEPPPLARDLLRKISVCPQHCITLHQLFDHPFFAL